MALVADSINEVNSGAILNPKGCNKNSLKLNNLKPVKLELPFKSPVQDMKKSEFIETNLNGLICSASLPEPAIMFTPRPVNELNEAATKVQKVYRSYRTRRNLADCAVVVEELWWKALDFATLKVSSVSFFNVEKPETAVSRWARARTRAAKVGKGMSKDEKAKKLALQHWLEAIDPRHRYGHNLHFYYDVWFKSESDQPFFYWLDVGDGKEVNLEMCPRSILHRQCIKYLGPKERVSFEVVIEDGKLVFKESGKLVHTTGDSKWIFVLSTMRTLYVGQKQKGMFQHSSFLAGGAITAAGRLVAREGVLEAIWPYSGHYHPTSENFNEFIRFLEEHSIDLSYVKTCAADDDRLLPSREYVNDNTNVKEESSSCAQTEDDTTDKAAYNLARHMSRKWSTGAGARIGCLREYPMQLQFQALDQVHLTNDMSHGHSSHRNSPIPSPRPSPKLSLSPTIQRMGIPTSPKHASKVEINT